jgi:hypothetical protein
MLSLSLSVFLRLNLCPQPPDGKGYEARIGKGNGGVKTKDVGLGRQTKRVSSP